VALWGVDKLRNRRMRMPSSLKEGAEATALNREVVEERLLLFQTGKALEAPLRFIEWAGRQGAAHDQPDLALEGDETEQVIAKIKTLLADDPQGAILTQGERVTDRAMQLIRPLRMPE
jgi:hypothetical protein